MTSSNGTEAVILTSALLASRGVPHAFSTRRGGVSRGIFASLNFGNPMDLAEGERDPIENIGENFRRVLAAAGVPGREVVQVYQVHGGRARVFRVGDASRDAGPRDFKADAMVSDDPSRALAVRVADCAPILIAGSRGSRSVVAAVHAGWRGVVAGVVHGAIKELRVLEAANLAAAIGPCICDRCFEVGPDVLAEFTRVFGSDAPIRTFYSGKGHADIRAALAMQLRAEGVEVDVLPHCSACSPDLFFSHRRDRGRTGRMIGMIAPA